MVISDYADYRRVNVAVLYLPPVPSPSPTANRVICEAVSEYAERRELDFSLIVSAEMLALNNYIGGGTVSDAIEEGQRFLRSFAAHPSRQVPGVAHDPPVPVLEVVA